MKKLITILALSALLGTECQEIRSGQPVPAPSAPAHQEQQTAQEPRSTNDWNTYTNKAMGFSFQYPPTSYADVPSLKDCAHTPLMVITTRKGAYLVDDRVYENHAESCSKYHLTTAKDIENGTAFVYFYVETEPVDSEDNIERIVRKHFDAPYCTFHGMEAQEDKPWLKSLDFEAETDEPDLFMSAGCNWARLSYNSNRKLIYIIPGKGNAALLWTSKTEYADGKYNLELF